MQPGEPPLLGREPTRIRGRVYCGDAAEEPLVLHDLVAESRQPRRHPPLNGPDRVVAHRTGEDVVDRHHPVERAARSFVGGDSVGERRGGRIGGDPLDGGSLLGHARHERRLEVFDPHPVERGHAAEGARPAAGQGIIVGKKCCGGYHRAEHTCGGHGLAAKHPGPASVSHVRSMP